jgi:hypothetical protein
VRDESDKLLAFWFARFNDLDLLVLARALANRRLGARSRACGSIGLGWE